ncbi:MAG TPA: molybdenum cofactor guanylyltransferase [Chloroflexi bacterium]|nr:MAG: hypothetical protein B6243_09435 [Anaerolineaceae bacterium 4572_5.2]HEY85314.1 molybdenum cofactor guanylyltransferase [Chloroflexota bacterium]
MDQSSITPFSVAILAGGQSRRMGQNKALMRLGGMSILQWEINAVKGLTPDLFLVTNSPQIYTPFNIPTIPDVVPGKAALGGIYTALTYAKHNWVLVLACDMPLLNPAIITFLAQQRQEADAVIPLVGNHPETLHAFYHKRCIPAVQKRISANKLKVIDFFNEVQVRYVNKEALQAITPDFDYLINLNTPAEFQRLEGIIAKK